MFKYLEHSNMVMLEATQFLGEISLYFFNFVNIFDQIWRSNGRAILKDGPNLTI